MLVVFVVVLFLFAVFQTLVIFRLRQPKPPKYDGSLNVIHAPDDSKKTLLLEIDSDPDEFEQMPSVLFQVVHKTSDDISQE
jgi:hypothetical protein